MFVVTLKKKLYKGKDEKPHNLVVCAANFLSLSHTHTVWVYLVNYVVFYNTILWKYFVSNTIYHLAGILCEYVIIYLNNVLELIFLAKLVRYSK